MLLIHDSGVDSRVWNEQVVELARRHRVVAVDQRGAGRSPRPGQEFDPVEDLGCAIRTLGLDRPILMGLGEGGEHALRVVAAHEASVRALVLVAPALSWALGRIAPREWFEDANEALGPILSEMDRTGTRAAIDRRDLAKLAQLNADFGGGLTAGHSSRDLLYAMALDNMEYVLDYSALELPGGQYTSSQVERIATPTLVITNSNPRLARWATLLAAHMPNCTVREMVTPASFVNLEAPRRFSELVTPFLEEVVVGRYA